MRHSSNVVISEFDCIYLTHNQTYVNEQRQELTNNLDKLRLKRKDAFLHDQTTNKKMKQLQQKHQSSIEIIDDSM
jgi:hypothetical protein